MEGESTESAGSGIRALIHFRLKHKNSDTFRRKSSATSINSDPSHIKKSSFLSSRGSLMNSFRTLRRVVQSKFSSNTPKSEKTDQNTKEPRKRCGCVKRLENSGFYKRIIKWQKMMYLMLEDPNSSMTAKIVFLFIILCIFCTLVESVIESYDNSAITNSNTLTVIDWIVSMTFTVELLLRWYACTAFGTKRWVYMIRPLNIVDVLGVIPFYVNLILVDDIVSINTLKSLRIIRFIRIVRVLKLGRYMKGTETFLTGLWTSLVSLGFIVYFVFVANLSSSVALYYAEYGSTFDTINDPSKLVKNAGDSMWWSIVTMTTTGYGDFVPQTIIAKVVGFITAIVGMFLFAIPIVILGNNFQQAFTNKQEAERVEQYKEKQRNENEDLDDAQREIRFMTERIEMIERTNNEIATILNDSKKKYSSVAKDIKHLYKSIYAGDEKEEEEKEKKEEVLHENNQAAEDKIETKIRIMEKLQKAKIKIKIANLFPKGLAAKKNFSNSDAGGKSNEDLGAIELSRGSSKRSSIEERNFERRKSLIKGLHRQETLFEPREETEFIDTFEHCNVNRVQVSRYENATADFSISSTKLRPHTPNTGKEETKINQTTNHNLSKSTKVVKVLNYDSEILERPSSQESVESDTSRLVEKNELQNGGSPKKRTSLNNRMKNSAKKRRSGRKITLTSRDMQHQAEKTKKVFNLAVRIAELLGEQAVPENTARTNGYDLDSKKLEEAVFGPNLQRNPLTIKAERKMVESIEVVEDSTDEPSEKMKHYRKRSPDI